MAKKMNYLSRDGGYTALSLVDYDRIGIVDTDLLGPAGQAVLEDAASGSDCIGDSAALNMCAEIYRVSGDELMPLGSAKQVLVRKADSARWFPARPFAELKPIRPVRVVIEFPEELIRLVSMGGKNLLASPESVMAFISDAIDEALVKSGTSMDDIETNNCPFNAMCATIYKKGEEAPAAAQTQE